VAGDRRLAVARVLVVEDDSGVQAVLVGALTDESYLVETAGSGEAALDLLDGAGRGGAFLPDVILLDIKMPGMGGLAFAEAYRRRPGRHAPIIVITASARLAEIAGNIGPADVVQKPFELVDLLERIAAVLRTT